MKLKISILILFLILSINNVYCETDIYTIEYQTDNIKTITPGTYDAAQSFSGISILDVDTITDVSFFGCYVPNVVWGGGTQNSNFSFANLYSNSGKTNYIGRGIIGYIKDGTSGYRVQLHVLSLDWGVLTGAQKIFWLTDDPLDAMSFKYRENPAGYLENGYGIWAARDALDRAPGNGCIHTTKIKYEFYNPIEYFYNSTHGFYELTLFRNSTYQSMWYVNDSNTLWKNETTLQLNNLTIYSYDLDNYTWNTHITTDNNDIIEINIDFSLLTIDDNSPTLTTDKTYYNISEIIEITYTNIDKIYDDCTSSFCDEAYQMWIYAIDPIEDIPKYRNWLYSDRRDETFVLNTSFLLPQTTYKLVITSGETNVMIESDIFYVYPDDEYLSVSCGVENNCYTYNNADITIYYKIDNNSDIIIKDNNDNIINTYHNIIDSGEILYHIPDDLNHINAYPNWKIYLNNTGYSTSFNKGVTVYWSQFQIPTPTPTFTPSPTPDINISNTIDEFKTETQPIKDLIFGLSEIVIDNPDYNKDNIVDESEINHWFNSLIPICIIFLLVVLYIGLKKKRE